MVGQSAFRLQDLADAMYKDNSAEQARGLQFYDALNQRTTQDFLDRRDRNDAAKANALSHLTDGIGMSGTPTDALISKGVADMQRNAFDLVRNNPRIRLTDLQMQLQQPRYNLINTVQQAKSAAQQAEDYGKLVMKDLPELDATRFLSDLNRDIYYDKNGQLLPSPNAGALANYRNRLATDEGYSTYLNKEEADKMRSKQLRDQYQPTPYVFQGRDQFNQPYEGSVNLNPWESWDARSNAQAIKGVPISMGGQHYNIADPDVLRYVPDNRLYRSFQRDLDQKLSANPEYQNLGDDEKNRIAASAYLQKYGSGDARRSVSKNYEGYRLQQQTERAARQDARAQEQLNIARENLALRKAKSNNKDAKWDDYYNVVNSFATNKQGETLDEAANDDYYNNNRYVFSNPDVEKKLKSKVISALPPQVQDAYVQSIISGGNPLANIQSADLTVNTKNGYVTSKIGDAYRPAKIISFKDKTSGTQVVLLRPFIDKRVKGVPMREFLDEKITIVKPEDVNQLIKRASSDFGLKEDDRHEVADPVLDFNYED